MRILKMSLKTCCLTETISPSIARNTIKSLPSTVPVSLCVFWDPGLATEHIWVSLTDPVVLWGRKFIWPQISFSETSAPDTHTLQFRSWCPGRNTALCVPFCTTACWGCHPVRDGLWSGQEARTQWPAPTSAKAPQGFDLLLGANVTTAVHLLQHRPEIWFSKAPWGLGAPPVPQHSVIKAYCFSFLSNSLWHLIVTSYTHSTRGPFPFLVLTVHTEPACPLTWQYSSLGALLQESELTCRQDINSKQVLSTGCPDS